MDLRPSSEFVLSYTDECDYNELLERTFNPIDEIFPEAAFTFLLEFFSKVRIIIKEIVIMIIVNPTYHSSFS